MKLKVFRLLLLVPTLVLLSACSGVQFAYRQLDWVLEHYAEEYFDFHGEQRELLERQVESLLEWHCRTQIGGYAELLRRSNRDLQSGQLSMDKLEQYRQALMTRWQLIREEAVPGIGRLLASIDEEQVGQLFATFEQRNQAFAEKYIDRPRDELLADYRERAIDELERWFGPLQDSQLEAVMIWSRALQPMGEQRLQMRRMWQITLRGALQQRTAAVDFSASLNELFLNYEKLRTATYRQVLAENWKTTLTLIHEVGQQTNAEQKRRLAATVASYSNDFEELACD